jgi:hypothetical protein
LYQNCLLLEIHPTTVSQYQSSVAAQNGSKLSITKSCDAFLIFFADSIVPLKPFYFGIPKTAPKFTWSCSLIRAQWASNFLGGSLQVAWHVQQWLLFP